MPAADERRLDPRTLASGMAGVKQLNRSAERLALDA
jgi:hypothetical protein